MTSWAVHLHQACCWILKSLYTAAPTVSASSEGGCRFILCASVSVCVCVCPFVQRELKQSGSTTRTFPRWKELQLKTTIGWSNRGEGLLWEPRWERSGQDHDAEGPKRESWIALCCQEDCFGTYWSSSWVNKHSCVRGGHSECWIKTPACVWEHSLSFLPGTYCTTAKTFLHLQCGK